MLRLIGLSKAVADRGKSKYRDAKLALGSMAHECLTSQQHHWDLLWAKQAQAANSYFSALEDWEQAKLTRAAKDAAVADAEIVQWQRRREQKSRMARLEASPLPPAPTHARPRPQSPYPLERSRKSARNSRKSGTMRARQLFRCPLSTASAEGEEPKHQKSFMTCSRDGTGRVQINVIPGRWLLKLKRTSGSKWSCGNSFSASQINSGQLPLPVPVCDIQYIEDRSSASNFPPRYAVRIISRPDRPIDVVLRNAADSRRLVRELRQWARLEARAMELCRPAAAVGVNGGVGLSSASSL